MSVGSHLGSALSVIVGVATLGCYVERGLDEFVEGPAPAPIPSGDTAAPSPGVAPSRPSARGDAAMAYDPSLGKVVLFGGKRVADGVLLADTWEYDGAWVMRERPGPSARAGHVLLWDTARARLVLYGGSDGGGAKSDVWTYKNGTWSMLELLANPTARAQHAAAADRQGVLVFGGESKNDVWRLTTSWAPVTGTSPPNSLWQHAMVMDGTGRVFVTGGRTSTLSLLNVSSDTMELVSGVWTKLTLGNKLPPVYEHAMVDAGARGVLVIGGRSNSGTNAVTWQFTSGVGWSAFAENPDVRYGHAAAYDPRRDVVVVFGGFESNDATWELQDATWVVK